MVQRQITIAASFEPGKIITRDGTRFRAIASSERGTIFEEVRRAGRASFERPEVLAVARARASTIRTSRAFRPPQITTVRVETPDITRVKSLFSATLSPKVRSILSFEAAGGGLEGARLQRFENLKASLAREKSNLDRQNDALAKEQFRLSKAIDSFNNDQDRLTRLARNNLLQEGVAIKNRIKGEKLNKQVESLNKRVDRANASAETFNRGVQAINRTEQAANVSVGKAVKEVKSQPIARFEAAPTPREVREELAFPPERIIPTEAEFAERRAETATGFEQLVTGVSADIGALPQRDFLQQLGLITPVGLFVGGAAEFFETGLRGVGAAAETGLGVVEQVTAEPISLRFTLPRETAQLISGLEDVPIIGGPFRGVGVRPVTPTATELLFGKPQVARAAVAATELELLLGFPGTRAAVKGVRAAAKIPRGFRFGVEEVVTRVKGKLVRRKPTPADIFEAETLSLEQFRKDFFKPPQQLTPVERREFLTLLTGEPARKGVRQFGKQRIDIETILKREFPLPGEEPAIVLRDFDPAKIGLSTKEIKEVERLVADIAISRGERIIPRFFRAPTERITGAGLRELEAATRQPIIFPKGIKAREILGFDARQTRAALLEELGIRPKVSKRKLAASKKFAADIKRRAAIFLKEEAKRLKEEAELAKRFLGEETGALGSFEQIALRLKQLQRRRRIPPKQLQSKPRPIEDEEFLFQQFFGPVPKAVSRPPITQPLTFERFLGASAVGLTSVQAQKLAESQKSLTAQLTGFAEVPALKSAKALKEARAQRLSEATRSRTTLASLLGVSTASLTGTAQLEGLRTLELVTPRRAISTRTTARTVPRITTVPRVPQPTRVRPPPLIPLLGPPTFDDLLVGRRPSREGFSVSVKTKGRFQKINRKPLTRGSALGLGASFVDRGVEKSFFITRSKKKTKPQSILGVEGTFNPFKFRRPVRRSKLPRETFIERDAFAIDTPGERQGITFKGLLALERRRGVRKILRLPTRRRKRKTKKKRKR